MRRHFSEGSREEPERVKAERVGCCFCAQEPLSLARAHVLMHSLLHSLSETGPSVHVWCEGGKMGRKGLHGLTARPVAWKPCRLGEFAKEKCLYAQIIDTFNPPMIVPCGELPLKFVETPRSGGCLQLRADSCYCFCGEGSASSLFTALPLVPWRPVVAQAEAEAEAHGERPIHRS